jgi:prepilin-type processing-associated H-X9-DG protein
LNSLRLSDIINPPPAKRYVFVDESEVTINEGFFEAGVGATGAQAAWLAWPANRHGGSGVFSFADGHAEIKKWLDARTGAPFDKTSFYSLRFQPNNPDITWVQERTTNLKPLE